MPLTKSRITYTLGLNGSLPLLLACNACPYDLGAVLSHIMPDEDGKAVSFASPTFMKAELNYSHLDKEALAIMYAVKMFHQYLNGHVLQQNGPQTPNMSLAKLV